MKNIELFQNPLNLTRGEKCDCGRDWVMVNEHGEKVLKYCGLCDIERRKINDLERKKHDVSAMEAMLEERKKYQEIKQKTNKNR